MVIWIKPNLSSTDYCFMWALFEFQGQVSLCTPQCISINSSISMFCPRLKWGQMQSNVLTLDHFWLGKFTTFRLDICKQKEYDNQFNLQQREENFTFPSAHKFDSSNIHWVLKKSCYWVSKKSHLSSWALSQNQSLTITISPPKTVTAPRCHIQAISTSKIRN